MQPFEFRIVPKGDASEHVPESTAMQAVADVQKLLEDIGRNMIAKEMRLQGEVPGKLLKRFDLSGIGSRGGNEVVAEGDDTLALDALNKLMEELDRANMPEVVPAPSDHVEAVYRRSVCRDILDLCDHLDGNSLLYGSGRASRKLRVNRRERLESDAENILPQFTGAIIGSISRDPARKGHWTISNGKSSVPITFGSRISPADIPLFVKAGIVIASGTVEMDPEGNVIGLSSATGIYSFPSVKFHRIITADRDIVLLNPAEAVPSHNPSTGIWSLSNDDLGIYVSKPSWDECVMAFHDYFAFLWETYKESEGPFEGEEQEIRDLLLTMEYIR